MLIGILRELEAKHLISKGNGKYDFNSQPFSKIEVLLHSPAGFFTPHYIE
jgi:hypothetical protein